MSGVFEPDPKRALALNGQVNAELADSLSQLSRAISANAEHLAALHAESAAPPAAFGFYYDLATTTRALLRSSPPAVDAPRYRKSPGSDPGVRITTLSLDFYSPEQIALFRRWLDTEPDNALDLVAVEPEELDRAGRSITKALGLLEAGCSDFFQEFQAITREIVLARPNGAQQLDFRGVSSFALWGALALNPQAHSDWIDYVPSLIHESAHSLLFGLARKGPLILNPREERYMSPLRQQPRPMDGLYHAAFVSAREAWVLQRCISNKALLDSSLLGGDTLGSLIFARDQSMSAFIDCLSVVRKHAHLTDLGQAILQDAERSCLAIRPLS